MELQPFGTEPRRFRLPLVIMKCPLVWWWLSLLACRCLAYKMDSYRKVAAQSDSLQAELATLREAVREEIKQTLTSEVAAQLRPQQVRPAFSEPAPQNSQRLTQLLKTVSANLSSAEGHLASRCSKKVTARVARKHPFASCWQDLGAPPERGESISVNSDRHELAEIFCIDTISESGPVQMRKTSNLTMNCKLLSAVQIGRLAPCRPQLPVTFLLMAQGQGSEKLTEQAYREQMSSCGGALRRSGRPPTHPAPHLSTWQEFGTLRLRLWPGPGRQAWCAARRWISGTWTRQCSTAFGQAARRLEGCQSSLASQTVRQAQAAVKGLYFLVFRMRAAGLGKPDQTTILEAIQRLKESYGRAMQGCEGTPFTAV
ncbi:unnamed protein product [Symbiodinium sp. CCMP2456]|nr:unnamed protein product [Symbiodinium sp. CCMP2456]